MRQVEGFVIVGNFSKHASKARDITNLRISYDCFKKVLTTSSGPLVGLSLTNSLPRGLCVWLTSTLSASHRNDECRNKLSPSLERVQAAREYDFTLVFAITKRISCSFVVCSTVGALVFSFCLDRHGKLDDSP